MLFVAGLVGLLAGPFLVAMLFLQGRAVANDLGSHRMSGFERLTYFLRALPATFTPVLLALAIIGMLLAWSWNKRGQATVMACWIVAGYATFTFFGQKEPRFAIYWFPPLVYFAVGVITQFFQKPQLRMRNAGSRGAAGHNNGGACMEPATTVHFRLPERSFATGESVSRGNRFV